MDTDLATLTVASKQIAQRLLTIGENRFELLLVELQEERERLLLAILLALGIAAFGLLAGVAFTIGIAVVFWEYHPLMAVFVLTAVYVIGAIVLYGRLVHLLRDWTTLASTLEQLRKDRECLEQTIG